MNNVESLLEHCHGEETHLSRNEGRTVSLSQMNNVESLLEHCHGEKTHFSRNEKEPFILYSPQYMENKKPRVQFKNTRHFLLLYVDENKK